MDIQAFKSFLVPPSKPTRNDESKLGKFQRNKQWQSSTDPLERMNRLCKVFILKPPFANTERIPSVEKLLTTDDKFNDQILEKAAQGDAAAIDTICKNLKALIYCIAGPEGKYKKDSLLLKTLIEGDNLFHFIENCRKEKYEVRNLQLHRPILNEGTALSVAKKVVNMGSKATAFLAKLDPGYGGRDTLLPEDKTRMLMTLQLRSIDDRSKTFSKQEYKEKLLQTIAQYKRLPQLLDYLSNLFDLGERKLLQRPQLYASMIDDLIDENFNLDQFVKQNRIDGITEPLAKKAFLKTILFAALATDLNIDNFSNNFVELYFYCKEDRRISRSGD